MRTYRRQSPEDQNEEWLRVEGPASAEDPGGNRSCAVAPAHVLRSLSLAASGHLSSVTGKRAGCGAAPGRQGQGGERAIKKAF